MQEIQPDKQLPGDALDMGQTKGGQRRLSFRDRVVVHLIKRRTNKCRDQAEVFPMFTWGSKVIYDRNNTVGA